MRDVRITGLARGPQEVAADTLDAFAGSLDGSLLLPDDAGFAEATLLWNGMIKKLPALAVRAASTDDVVRTVEFAGDQGLELSIRGGGHNIAGLALSDGGITLDMSQMKAVEVDVDGRRAAVGPGPPTRRHRPRCRCPGRRTPSRREPPSTRDSPGCCSAWVVWRCWWAASGSPTSW
jgi:hypothetical protein